ncbi:MAG: hypothetical protein KDC33_05085 [Thermoleophilia bacterium]|nr:hypothetical protein [Thermoleophilia bacterium]
MPSAMPKPSDEARARFDEAVDRLAAERDVARAPMFGMPAVKVAGGRAFAGLFGDGLTAKLGRGARERALGLEGAGPFDPMGGRPMREWVLIPLAHAGEWDAYMRAAEEYVRGAAV